MVDAPRFRAYLEHAEGRPVVHVARRDWDALTVSSSNTTLIDIERIPLGNVARDASVVAAYGQRFSEATAEIGVIRHDPSDAPNVYNTDKYLAWVDLPSHQSFTQIVAAASTQDNANLRRYMDETVFLVKLEPDEDHHRPDLPETLKLLLDPPGR